VQQHARFEKFVIGIHYKNLLYVFNVNSG
jgi:hypothetical protein